MKKLLFIAALAVGMVGCTSEEEVVEKQTPSQIALQGVAKKTTRGGLDGATLPDQTLIYCTGLLHGSGSTSFFFNNQTFHSTSTGWWINEGISWPITSGAGTTLLDFWAYTCTAYNNESTSEGWVTKYYDTPTPTATFSRSEYAFTTLDLDFGNALKGQNDVMVSDILAGVDCHGKTDDDHQNLTFRHALAWVVVQITATGSALDNKFKFYDITLDDVQLSGKLTVDGTVSAPHTFTWTPYETSPGVPETQDMKFPAYGEGAAATGVLLGDATSRPLDGILVLPQAATKIILHYAYEDGGSFDNGQTTEIDLNSYTPNWEMGKKYVYKIKIDTSSDKFIVLGATVTDYDKSDFVVTP